MSTKIKICGITKPEEAAYLNETKVDYAGFVFYEKSKRNITIKQAKDIFSCLDNDIKRVAVMVSPKVEDIIEKQENDFDILQVHGDLTLDVLKSATLPVWYAINISDETEANRKMTYIDELPDELASKIEALVVDAPSFGSGQTFNWKKSKRLKKAGAQSPPLDKMFVLAGGLNASNVKEGIELFNPDVVDISSNVEGKNGKDRDLIFEFVKAVKE